MAIVHSSSSTKRGEAIVNIYLLNDGQTSGPFDEAEIRRGVEEGRYSPQNLAWTSGKAAWHPLNELIHLGWENQRTYTEMSALTPSDVSGDAPDTHAAPSGQRPADEGIPVAGKWMVLITALNGTSAFVETSDDFVKCAGALTAIVLQLAAIILVVEKKNRPISILLVIHGIFVIWMNGAPLYVSRRDHGFLEHLLATAFVYSLWIYAAGAIGLSIESFSYHHHRRHASPPAPGSI